MDAEALHRGGRTTGLIGPLTISIMEQAMKEARDWPAHLKLAVNVSPVQFRDPSLAEQILKLLVGTGFPANRLEIEITEGSLLEDREQVLTIIASLKNVGVRISLDDFGTGYASLAQVNRLPLDRIKIDKSFITTIVKSQRTAEIVNTIAALGHTLDVPISAEGVESEQIRAALEQVRLLGSAGLAVRPRGLRRGGPQLPEDERSRRRTRGRSGRRYSVEGSPKPLICGGSARNRAHPRQ